VLGAAFIDDFLGRGDCGDDLEFDAAFVALAAAAKGKAEQQFGDTIVEAEEPDWRDLEQQALALLERSRDIRIIGYLATARLRTQGITGYAAAVRLIARLLDTQWEAVHPRLDPEDDNDPTLRANAVLAIGDPKWVLRALRDLPLTRAPRAGRLTWNQVAQALHLVEADDTVTPVTETVVAAAFAETDAAWMEATRDSFAALVLDLKAINAAFEDKAGFGTSPDLERLEKLVGDINRVLLRFKDAAADEAAPEAEAELGTDVGGGTAPAARRGGGSFASAMALQEVASRQEALHIMDVACRYFERHEPSSPLPLLVKRALRLADKNFLDILRDMAPDGVSQAQQVFGSYED